MNPISIALIGCGGFVNHTHFHNLNRHPGFSIHATVDVNEASARAIAEKAGSAYWTATPEKVLADPEVELVFIATPHFTHAKLSEEAARAGKHIYCEKPMGLTEAECQSVMKAVEGAGIHYIAGYNRALAPFTRKARHLLSNLKAPLLSVHRFADFNPYGTGWLIDEAKSGGRIIGEAGHALDTLCRLTGQDPVRLWAEGGNFAEPSTTGAPDSALITAGFPDGSAGTLLLSSVGNNGFPKEELQITCANHTLVIRGFEEMQIYGPDGVETHQLPEADKGNYDMLDMTYHLIRKNGPNHVGLKEAYRASRLTFAANRSIREGKVQFLD